MDRITDPPDMTSAVYRGRKASTQTNKQTIINIYSNSLKHVAALFAYTVGVFHTHPEDMLPGDETQIAAILILLTGYLMYRHFCTIRSWETVHPDQTGSRRAVKSGAPLFGIL